MHYKIHNWKYCKKTNTHKCARTGRVWKINFPIDCTTSNVIYKITCKKHGCCHFVYIGESKRQLKERIREHIGDIANNRDTAVGRHFNLPGHSVADLVVEGIEKIVAKPREGKSVHQMRKIRESYWINQYEATRYGANVRN